MSQKSNLFSRFLVELLGFAVIYTALSTFYPYWRPRLLLTPFFLKSLDISTSWNILILPTALLVSRVLSQKIEQKRVHEKDSSYERPSSYRNFVGEWSFILTIATLFLQKNHGPFLNLLPWLYWGILPFICGIRAWDIKPHMLLGVVWLFVMLGILGGPTLAFVYVLLSFFAGLACFGIGALAALAFLGVLLLLFIDRKDPTFSK